jgi:hypothetical protein
MMSRPVRILFACVIGVVGGAVTQAQWLNHAAPGTPRGKDGKPNLAARAPRAADGKPDLSGVWVTELESPAENERLFGAALKAFAVPGDDPSTFSKYYLNILADFTPENTPMRPVAAEQLRRNMNNRGDTPISRCLPHGIPRTDIFSYAPFKIVQTPGMIAVLYEIDNNFRQIYTDGRALPIDPQPSWVGYSVGRWDGDTLIVDAAGFNDRTWLDSMGHPHSEALRLRERFRRRDFGHMDLEVTVDDPTMYTRPFTIKVAERLLPDSDVLELVCSENEKDRAHFEK